MAVDPSVQDTLSKVLIVENQMGIHARPAAMIVRLANKFSSTDLWVEKGEDQVNGKSIMGLMMLAAGKGSRLRFIVSGSGGEALLMELEKLFKSKFDEN